MRYVIGTIILSIIALTGCTSKIEGYISSVSSSPEVILSALSVTGANTVEGNDTEFTVTLTVSVNYPITVDYLIQDGTATSPDDHAGGSGQVIIYPGDGLSRKIYVSTIDDAIHEGDETLDITISNSEPSSVVIDTATATSTIKDRENGCPNGFIPVVGNSTLITNDFCVAKYEMKGISGNISSEANGSPYVSLAPSSAFTECSNMSQTGYGDGTFALISNPEWMTIARDIEATADNWEGGRLARGWSATTSGSSDPWFNSAVAPSTDAACLYNVGSNACGASGDITFRRTHTLSNGEKLWDFSGNVWEFVDWDSSDGVFTKGPTGCPDPWYEFSTSCGALTNNDYKPLGTYTSAENIGTWYGTWSGGIINGAWHDAMSNGTAGVPIRGGGYGEGWRSGVFTLALSSTAINSISNQFGFRCVYRPAP